MVLVTKMFLKRASDKGLFADLLANTSYRQCSSFVTYRKLNWWMDGATTFIVFYKQCKKSSRFLTHIFCPGLKYQDFSKRGRKQVASGYLQICWAKAMLICHRMESELMVGAPPGSVNAWLQFIQLYEYWGLLTVILPLHSWN